MAKSPRSHWVARAAKSIGEVVYGMAFHDMVRLQQRERSYLEHLFMLITFGDYIGIPILPPYYTLSLLPYIVPQINAWRRRLLRERDLTDLIG
jgi:hypothetical protein